MLLPENNWKIKKCWLQSCTHTHTPNRKAHSGNSKSCPPTKSGPSPIKDLIKPINKLARRNFSSCSNVGKKDKQLSRQNSSERCPNRAGRTDGPPVYFTKPVEIPVRMEVENELDPYSNLKIKSWLTLRALDLRSLLSNKLEMPVANGSPITLKLTKTEWSSSLLTSYSPLLRYGCHQNEAPWTDAMIFVDVRQASMVAILKSWSQSWTLPDSCFPTNQKTKLTGSFCHDGSSIVLTFLSRKMERRCGAKQICKSNSQKIDRLGRFLFLYACADQALGVVGLFNFWPVEE